MISVKLEAEMRCDHEGCEAKLSVALALSIMGGFVPIGSAEGWQVGPILGPRGEPGPYSSRCPKHHQLVTSSRAIPGIATAKT